MAQSLEIEEEFKVGFNTLNRGELYPISKIVRTECTIRGNVVKGLKAEIVDDELALNVYLPKKVVESTNDEVIKEINEAGTTAEKFTTCYYGTLESNSISSFVGRIHRPGQSKFLCSILCLFCCNILYNMSLFCDVLIVYSSK